MNSNRHGKTTGRRRSRRATRRLRNLFLAGLALVGIAGVAFYALGNRGSGLSAEQIAAATGTLTAEQAFHDFGVVSMKDGVVTYPFRLRNTGSAPALIRKIYTS